MSRSFGLAHYNGAANAAARMAFIFATRPEVERVVVFRGVDRVCVRAWSTRERTGVVGVYTRETTVGQIIDDLGAA